MNNNLYKSCNRRFHRYDLPLVFSPGPNTTEHLSMVVFRRKRRDHRYCTQFQRLRSISHTRDTPSKSAPASVRLVDD
jgi:hypothetical protein